MNGAARTSILELYPRFLTKPLSREEERRLLCHKDRQAVERLVYANVRFVIQVAKPYWMSYGGDLEDYVQEGVIGLMRAIEKYDTQRTVKLISYAVSWIRVFISNYVMKTYSLVKIGTTQYERTLFFALSRYRRELAKGGVYPSDEKLAEYIGVKVEQLKRVETRLARDVSLDMPVRENDEDTLLDGLASNSEVEREVIESERVEKIRTQVHEALDVLDSRERGVIEGRFLNERKKTLKECGDEYDFSRERARQLEQRAKEKMRDKLHGAKDLLTG